MARARLGLGGFPPVPAGPESQDQLEGEGRMVEEIGAALGGVELVAQEHGDLAAPGLHKGQSVPDEIFSDTIRRVCHD